jgi:signal transduction histidine kinase
MNADGPVKAQTIQADAIPVHRVETDFPALLAATVELMQSQARAIDASLTLAVAPDVPRWVRLDPGKIAWVITALVGNALRFVSHGTRLRPGGTIRVDAHLAPGSPHLLVEISDDGSGIPQELLSQLLTPLATRPYATGLALGLVRDVVAAHGGTVQIESSTNPGSSGTTIRLTLACS